MEYYSVIKKNKFTGKWIEVEKLILSDITQTNQDIYVMDFLYVHENVKSMINK